MRDCAYVDLVGHGHGHGSTGGPARGGESTAERHLGRLVAALAIAATVLVLEVAVGLATSSLALLSDAAHMLTDVVGVGLAVAAIVAARRAGSRPGRTFGLYRAEVLAALANAVLLFGVAGYVVAEAIGRLDDPPEVAGLPVLLAAALGMVANLVAFALLRSGSRESLAVRGAYLEVLADLIGSVGVLLSGAVMLLFDWRYADPIIGVAIGLWVLPRAWTLARGALRILFQHAPAQVDVAAMSDDLAALPGVNGVHDLHVWTLTSGMEVASAHLTLHCGAVAETVLAAAQRLLAEHYQIEHATLQVEAADSTARCRELTW